MQSLCKVVVFVTESITSCFGLMTDSAVVDSALVDAALRKSGLISNGCSGLIIYYAAYGKSGLISNGKE